SGPVGWAAHRARLRGGLRADVRAEAVRMRGRETRDESLARFTSPIAVRRKRSFGSPPTTGSGGVMKCSSFAVLAIIGGFSALPHVASAQSPATAAVHPTAVITKVPDRAIRRDIPMTNMIRRAFAAGTRDSSGRPGKNYWLIWNDYTISARFDAPTSMVSGLETIVVHNNSPNPMNSIQMRLDQNLFAANVPRAEVVTDITDGLKLTKLVVNGQAVDLNPPSGRGRGGGGGGGVGGGGRGGAAGADSMAPRVPTATGLNLTSARITPAAPIPAGGTVTIEAEWNFKVPKSDGARGIRMGS